MTFRLLFSHDDASTIGKPLDRDDLATLYAPPRRLWLRVNLVQSLTGSIVGDDGTSNSLTTPHDRTLLHVIREQSDIILVGARTVIAEGLYQTQGIPTAILCGAWSLTPLTLPNNPTSHIILLVPESSYHETQVRWADSAVQVVSLPETEPGHASISEAIYYMRAGGYKTITCEGGAHLASTLVSSQQVDELCLTIRPTIVPATQVSLTSPLHERSFTLTHLVADTTSTLYTRWSAYSSSASN